MDWDKLKIFHAVAEAGSFTNATVNLNLSQSAISRQIQALEHDLKVQLFERHARGLTLTENGEYVFKTAHEVISKLKEVETSLGDQKNKPTGKLTIITLVPSSQVCNRCIFTDDVESGIGTSTAPDISRRSWLLITAIVAYFPVAKVRRAILAIASSIIRPLASSATPPPAATKRSRMSCAAANSSALGVKTSLTIST